MLDEYSEYILGTVKQGVMKGDIDDTLTEASRTSWLGSMNTTKDDLGLLDDPEEEFLLNNKTSDTGTTTNGYFSKLKNHYSDDNKWVKSLKNYNNPYIAIGLWCVGSILLFMALCEVPFIAIFPKSFLRNMSLGSSCIYTGLAFYMGPYNYFCSLFSNQTIVFTCTSYLVCTLIAVYC